MINKRKYLYLLSLIGTAILLFGGGLSIQADNGTPIFINEIHYDNAGADTNEGIEVAGPAGTDLNGWHLVLYNGNGGVTYENQPLNGIIADQQNGFGTVFFTIEGIQNGPDGIALIDGGDNVIQFLSYEGTMTASDGPAVGMTSTDIGVSESSSTTTEYALQLTGTGTVYEDFTWSGPAPHTFGAVNAEQVFSEAGGSPPPPPPPPSPSASLLINEIDYDQPGADDAEFIEIKNAGDEAVNLASATIELINGNGSTAYQTIELPAAELAAGAYYVVCSDTNTVVNCDLQAVSSVQNGAPDAVALLWNGELVDVVSYEGDTAAPYTEGSGTDLVDDGSEPLVGISRYPDGVDTDQNNVDFSPRCTTPGTANSIEQADCMPPAPPGTITIVKEATPAGGQDFSFTGDLGDFSLDDAVPNDGDNISNTHTVTVSPGTYQVVELGLPGWTLNGLNCTTEDVNDSTLPDINEASVTIDLDPAEAVTCTFTNVEEEPTAVELISFTGSTDGVNVTLNWETAAEVNSAGFNLYRAPSLDGPWTIVNAALVAAKGDAAAGASYSYVDTPGLGTFHYQLEEVDRYGTSTRHRTITAALAPPFRRPGYRPSLPTLTLLR